MSKGLMFAAIASNPELHVEGKVLEILEYGNDTLVDTLDEFMSVSRESAVQLSCFWEQKITNIGVVIGEQRIEEYVVDEVSGSLEGHPKCGLSRDHFRMNKFSDPLDGDYIMVQDEIEEMYKRGLSKTEQPHKRSQILQWISLIPYNEHARLAALGMVPDTGQWLLSHEKFRAWAAMDAPGILWLRGDRTCRRPQITSILLTPKANNNVAGTGKTKLVSSVISTLTAKEPHTPLAFFFCSRGENERRDPTTIARTLVKQLASLSEETMRPLALEYDRQEQSGFSDGPPSLDRCQELILEILAISKRVILVIDALDECHLGTRGLLLKMLQNVSRTTGGETKCFVASRNDDDIVLQLEGVPNHYIKPTDSQTDIHRFVETIVTAAIRDRRLLRGKVSDELKRQIVRELSRGARGMFLWVAFQIDSLCSMSLQSDVCAKLGRLPVNLEKTYDEIYHMIMTEGDSAHEIAQYVILWIISAFRPLSPREMFSALSWSGVEEPLSLDILLKICHNLVIIDHELNVLRLTHLSVREYFEKYHLAEEEGHAIAAQAFFWRSGQDPVPSGLDEDEANDAITEYLLLHWPFHAQKSELATKESAFSVMLNSFLGQEGTPSSRFQQWRQSTTDFIKTLPPRERYQCKLYRFITPTESDGQTPLPFAAVFGFSEYYSHLFVTGQESLINSRNRQGETMLMLAAREGHIKLVQLLLKHGAEVNATITKPFNDYANALQAAAVGGHVKTVELLLEARAEINAEGGRHASALQAAAYYGHEKVVRLLHERGGKNRVGKGHFGNAIQAASYAGSERLVKYLLQAGENVNDFAGKYGSPLASAVYKGHVQIVVLLLKMKADVNQNIGAFGSALHLACVWGHEGIVNMLLDAGASLSAVDHSGRIPLHDAVSKGQKHLLPKLIRLSKDPRAMDDNGWTPLDEAIWRGRTDIEAIFAEFGILASQIPEGCILPSKDRKTLVKSALELAFHDMQRDESWLEYALPNLRYSFFYLKKNDIAHRACQEISERWGWVCESCRRTCDRELQWACTECFATDLCDECFEARETDLVDLPTCSTGHTFIPIDLEIGGPDLWEWLHQAQNIFDDIMQFRSQPLHPQQRPIIRQTEVRF
ncbi:hypothetical protein LTS15_011190 [Exophiala xenobiotica]|nr:hypothetical protein LTS15_011190 [Exophiala xenobiotica]